MLAPETFQGAMAEGQIELADQAAGAEGGQGLTECEELAFEVSGVRRGWWWGARDCSRNPEGPCC